MAIPKLPPIPQQLPKTQAEWDRFVNVMQQWMRLIAPGAFVGPFNGKVSAPGISTSGVLVGADDQGGAAALYPEILFVNSQAGTDAHYWRIYSDETPSLHFDVLNDAWSASNQWLLVSRNGYTITGLTFSAPITVGNGTAGAVPSLVINSGFSATQAAAEVHIKRSGSTSNSVGQGPALELDDVTNGASAILQCSGNQFELWTLYTGSGWTQALKVDINRSLWVYGSVIADSGSFYSNNGATRLLMNDANDGWMRLNQNGNFANGMYTPGSLRIDGTLYRNDSGVQNNYLVHASGHSSARVYVSTSAPSGGSDGDIWLQHS